MSGGVGSTADDVHIAGDDDPTRPHVAPHRPPGRLLSFQQLNALVIAVILSSTGLVSLFDTALALLSFPYLYFLSSFAFPASSSSASSGPVFASGPRSFLLSLYIAVGALVGLFLPVAYILHGVLEGDKEGIKAAAPHVFLLACQIFMEGVTFNQNFSLPIRVLVPVLYNGWRLFSLADWVSNEVDKAEREEGGSEMRVQVGRALAVVNMAFWGFNLFGFLLPVYCPKAFAKYYQGKLKV